MSPSFQIVSDNHSDHNLPIGAIVTPVETPKWAKGTDATWYTLGGDEDEVAIDPRDLRELVTDTTVVEVHGNDGTSHLTAAENWAKKNVPGLLWIEYAEYGVGRCEHGDLLVAVTYTKEKA